MMEVAQEFCLKWNNYQSTLHHFFHRLWTNGIFVDVTLIVDGRRIDCHRVILSACSTYFEQLLRDHATHPHPLILLHDLPFPAVEALVSFMYSGEINVSHDQLAALLKVADALKIKGLADSEAIANFTKYRLMSPDITKITTTTHLPYNYHFNHPPSSQPYIPVNGIGPSPRPGFPFSRPPTHLFNGKRQESATSHSPKPPKKRCRQEEASTSLPPSPPMSLESQNVDLHRCQETDDRDEVKVETEEETDSELQIDESVGQSFSDYAEANGRSSQNTPVNDIDSRDSDERHETAKSLAALATQGTPFHMLDTHSQSLLIPKVSSTSIKADKGLNGPKNGERTYTLRDLEEGIESVLMGQLTPAKAIAKFKVPRRTFFRRLSAVRKSRGIPSSKENSSEQFLTSIQSISPSPPAIDNNGQQMPLVSGIVSTESSFIESLAKAASKANSEALLKKDKKSSNVTTSGNVFSLLNVAANPSYEYYLKYLKLQGHPQDSDEKPGIPMDSNRNLAESVTPEKALALVTQNGSAH